MDIGKFVYKQNDKKNKMEKQSNFFFSTRQYQKKQISAYKNLLCCFRELRLLSFLAKKCFGKLKTR